MYGVHVVAKWWWGSWHWAGGLALGVMLAGCSDSGSADDAGAIPVQSPSPTLPTSSSSAASSASSSSSSSSGSTAPSAVELYEPAPNRYHVSLRPRIEVHFASPITDRRAAAQAFELRSESGAVQSLSLSTDDGQRFFGAPQTRLEPNQRYRVVQTDPVVSDNGLIDPGTAWPFTTTLQLAATSQFAIDHCMDDDARYTLDRLNRVRAAGADCGGDLLPPAAPLSYSCTLAAAGAAHSVDMRDVNYFSHTGSDGGSVVDRIEAQGYAWRAAGENIAAGQLDAVAAFTGLLNSPGHCRNMLSVNFTEFGLGYAAGGGDYGRYWTQVFARPR